MNPDPFLSTGPLGALPPHLEEVCDRFEAALRAVAQGGARPRLEDHLAGAPEAERPAVLPELIALEVAYRKGWGEEPRGEEYRQRFPGLDPARLDHALGARPAAGSAPPPTATPRNGADPTGAETPPTGSARRVRCPHCHNPIQLADGRPDEVLCPGCGSSFRVCDARATATATRMRPLGKFQLLERIGLGAFGAVWKARDTELDRVVALKIPHTGLLTADEDLERFHREARAAAQLRHPGIVTVHEVTTLEGLPTIVADFVEGVPLKDLLEVRRLTFREAAQLVAEVAEALDYAHTMGLVHRDIKPANIMVELGRPRGSDRADPGIGRPLLMDFGLALREQAEVTLTLDGQVIGTPAYMSPEQAAGRGHRVDRRSDVYSLGVVLYELLTAELPFRGSKVMILHQVLNEEPRPPRRVNDKIPRDLETVCLKALAKEPSGRYGTARDLADDLRRFLKGEPVRARPVGRAERLRRWCRRNPALAGLTAAVPLLLLATLAVTAVGYWRVARANREVEAQRDRALKREREAVSLRNQEAAARKEAETKGHQARESLRRSLLHQAEALRQTTQAGRRQPALEALKQAAAIRPGLDLRNEYLRCLDLPDLRPVRDLANRDDPALVAALPGRLRGGADYQQRRYASYTYWLSATAVFRGRGHRILLSPAGGRPVEFDAMTGNLLGVPGGVGEVGRPAALSPDGRLLAAATPDREGAEVWDLKAGKRLGKLRGRNGLPLVPLCLAFSRGSDLLAVATEVKERGRTRYAHFFDRPHDITLFDTQTLAVAGTWRFQAEHIDCLAFGPSGRMLAASILSNEKVGLNPHAILLWTFPNRLTELPGLQVKVARLVGSAWLNPWRALAWLPLLPKCPIETKLILEPTYRQWSGGQKAGRIDFSPDGRFLAAAGSLGTVKAWALDERGWQGPRPREVFSIRAHTAPAHAAQFSPDGRWLATAGDDGLLNLWDAQSGSLVAQARAAAGSLHGYGSQTPVLQWSASGSLLLSGTDRGLRLWEVTRPLSRSALHLKPREEVTVLRFSPGEKWLGACALNSPQKLFNLQGEGRERLELEYGGSAQVMAFSADGDKFGSVSYGSSQGVWQLPAVKPERSTEDRTRHIRALAFNPDGERVAAGIESVVELGVIDLGTGQPLWRRSERAALLNGRSHLRFSPDGNRLVAAKQTPGRFGSLEVFRVRNAATGKLAYERTEQMDRPLFVRNNRLMVLSDKWTLTVRDFEEGKPWNPLRQQGSYSRKFFFSDDGMLCAEAGEDEIAIWDFARKALRTKFKLDGIPDPNRFYFSSLVFNRDGSRIAGQEGKFLKVWDTWKGKELGRLPGRPALFVFVGGARESEQLLLIDTGRRVLSWRPGAKEPTPVGSLKADRKLAFSTADFLRMTADRKRVIHVSRRPNVPAVYLWEIPSGSLVARHPLPRGLEGWREAAVSPDGRRLALVNLHSISKAWNLDRGTVLLDRGERTYSASYPFDERDYLSDDGNYLLVWTRQEAQTSVRVFDLAGRSEIFAADWPGSGTCYALANQARLVAVGFQNQALIYDPRSGRKAATLESPDADFSDVEFDRSGRLLASACGKDGTVRLWDPAAGKLLAVFATGQKQLTRVALSPTGKWLAAADSDQGQVLVWDLFEARRRLAEAGLDWSASPAPGPADSGRSAAALLEAAHAHHLHGRYPEAVTAYGKALRLDGSLGRAFRDRGEALFQLKRYSEALADFAKAREVAPELPFSPNFARAFLARAGAHAERGRWARAAADYAQATEIAPADFRCWQGLALARLAGGDQEGYRRACAALLGRFGQTDDPQLANSVTWVCALGPRAVSDPGRPVALGEMAVGAEANRYFLNTLGAALYRAGRFREAASRLNDAVRAHGNGGVALDWLFLAMAHHRLGHAAEARQWLAKAVKWIDQFSPEKYGTMPAGAPLSWTQRLELRLLRREAEGLLRREVAGPNRPKE